MNWCQPHWDQLRAAIKERGLDGFGAKDGQAAAKAMADELEGAPTDFDPLLGSFWRINLAMAESLTKQGRGGEVLQLRCPLCILVEDGQPTLVKNWIDGATNSALDYAVSQGLIKTH